MCLQFENKAVLEIADRDIICYKILFPQYNSIKSEELIKYDNYEFEGIIKQIKCSGKIRVENDQVFFCTNISNLNGIACQNRYGFLYSYRLSQNVAEITILATGEKYYETISGFKTPYMDAKVEIGKTYISNLDSIEAKDGDKVEKGLHSYEGLNSAIYNTCEFGTTYIAQCIIPKGARYYKGTFFDEGSYASDILKYVEIIEK